MERRQEPTFSFYGHFYYYFVMTHMGVGEYFGGLYFKPSKTGVDFFVSPVGLGELRHTQMRCTKL